jgi:hypothetical protein
VGGFSGFHLPFIRAAERARMVFVRPGGNKGEPSALARDLI